MKILVTGFLGYVGEIICSHFADKHEIYGTSSSCAENDRNFTCDLRNEVEAKALSEKIQPDIVIHAAGQKDISFCESHSAEAFAINCIATENVARFFGAKSRIFYISTDYVFDGRAGNYAEDDAPSPLTVYGKSKLAGEQQGLKIAGKNFTVIRTAALYNDNSKFIEYLTDNLSSGQAVSCFTDTFYSPTYYADLLTLIERLLSSEYDRQIYHVCGSRTSRFEFAISVAQAFNYDSALIQSAIRPSENWFLLPDLSLNSITSQTLLRHRQTSHLQALQQLATRRETL